MDNRKNKKNRKENPSPSPCGPAGRAAQPSSVAQPRSALLPFSPLPRAAQPSLPPPPPARAPQPSRSSPRPPPPAQPAGFPPSATQLPRPAPFPLAFGLLGGLATSAWGVARSPGRCGQGGCPAAAATQWGPPVSPKGSRPMFISLLPTTRVFSLPPRSSLAQLSLLSSHRASRTELLEICPRDNHRDEHISLYP
jgi:hypothetical protein